MTINTVDLTLAPKIHSFMNFFCLIIFECIILLSHVPEPIKAKRMRNDLGNNEVYDKSMIMHALGVELGNIGKWNYNSHWYSITIALLRAAKNDRTTMKII